MTKEKVSSLNPAINSDLDNVTIVELEKVKGGWLGKIFGTAQQPRDNIVALFVIVSLLSTILFLFVNFEFAKFIFPAFTLSFGYFVGGKDY